LSNMSTKNWIVHTYLEQVCECEGLRSLKNEKESWRFCKNDATSEDQIYFNSNCIDGYTLTNILKYILTDILDGYSWRIFLTDILDRYSWRIFLRNTLLITDARHGHSVPKVKEGATVAQSRKQLQCNLHIVYYSCSASPHICHIFTKNGPKKWRPFVTGRTNVRNEQSRLGKIWMSTVVPSYWGLCGREV